MSLQYSPDRLANEIERIVGFLSSRIQPGEKAVLGLSGGIDSDVTARLAVRALGAERLKLFTVVQADMELRHLRNARKLATELGIPLVEIPLTGWAPALINMLMQTDPHEGFSNSAFLDVGRAKNSLRTVVYSTYHDRGYITLGTSNRTEVECGFFVRLGDGIWHLGPLAHLYKTQVYQLAAALGCDPEVIRQPASAGYWNGESDLEDIAYWLVNEKPVGAQRYFSPAEIELARAIRSELTFDRIDRGLQAIAGGKRDAGAIAASSALSVATAHRLLLLIDAARTIRGLPLGVRLESCE
ncbi:NAD(+) synthase [Sulfuritalea hydrogenivorans]|uniref:NH(3)-dependent NAD(+) synthetase n=1 Tax=Sulfuritalea hydrogenivorans sk43H TaxID=1223802 RepID=W0SFY0_9PROT|nr:NAD(+) synthase [Sulfuritalea hydrogenivorans]BAO29936.1 NH(3)-dependent NAD(+) synthetase [Sulfuritalea hydrogenivorans sk43H]